MTLSRKTWFLLRYNWGFAFVLAFMIFLVWAAVNLSIGIVSFANTLATFGFYALVVGVVLQIVSYMIYGNKPYPNEQSTTLPVSSRFESSRRYKIVAIVVIISVAAGMIGIQYFSGWIPIIGIQTTTHQACNNDHSRSVRYNDNGW